MADRGSKGAGSREGGRGWLAKGKGGWGRRRSVSRSLDMAGEHWWAYVGCQGPAGRNPGGVREVLGGPGGGCWRGYKARVTGVGTWSQEEAGPSAGASRMTEIAVRHRNDSA